MKNKDLKSEAQEALKDLEPSQGFFVGIDSDGCAFDTMEIKHKECFCPNTILYWKLQTISKYAREAWEFVNLYSKSRGVNRFIALVEVIRLLKNRKEVRARKIELPDMTSLTEWIKAETKLGNPALQAVALEKNDPILDLALLWSKAVNNAIADMVHDMPPYPGLRESVIKLQDHADIMVVSSTPLQALESEWNENDLARYTRFIAGQEHGSKKEHIALAAKGKYDDHNILMVGDAPGDMEAAKKNGVLFFPIIPGEEEKSWDLFLTEGIDRFLKGKYAGAYEKKLIARFDKSLPDKPPW
ncbi:MAG TPA: HAD hydrolase-like protein [Cyclobacteriaceae bacterium]|nr:HAD hydrolase-like protein [Cyclobacteriaceae bacterium]